MYTLTNYLKVNSLCNRHPGQVIARCQPPTPEGSQMPLPKHNALFPPRNRDPDSNEYNCLVSLYLLVCHFTIHPKMVSFTLSTFELYIVQNHRVFVWICFVCVLNVIF